MKWESDNTGSIFSQTHGVIFLNLWNFETLKRRNQETTEPRNQETRKLWNCLSSIKAIPPPLNIPTLTPAPAPLLGNTSELGGREYLLHFSRERVFSFHYSFLAACLFNMRQFSYYICLVLFVSRLLFFSSVRLLFFASSSFRLLNFASSFLLFSSCVLPLFFSLCFLSLKRASCSIAKTGLSTHRLSKNHVKNS